MPVNAPTPRTEAQCRATAARLRRDATAMRDLLADPGAGAEDFKKYGPRSVNWKFEIAHELEAIADE